MKDFNKNTASKIQLQGKEKREDLKLFIENSYYIEFHEQPKIAKQFNVPYCKKMFSDVYRKRFFDFLKINTTTIADVRKNLGIPEKILCQWKTYFEKRELLIVICKGVCPAEGSNNVGFLTTNENLIKGFIDFTLNNQTKFNF